MLDVAAMLIEVDGAEVLLVAFDDEPEVRDVNVELFDAAPAVKFDGVDPAVPVVFSAVAGVGAAPVALAEAATGTTAVPGLEVVPLAGAAGTGTLAVDGLEMVPLAAAAVAGADAVVEVGAITEPVETPATVTGVVDVQ